MTLCVDIGNTATKLAIVSSNTVMARRVVATAALGGGAGFPDACRALVTGAGRRPRTVAVASVVPGAAAVVSGFSASEWNVAAVVVGATSPLPFRLGVENPGSVGADRLCAAAGAVDGDHRDAVVVDIGSAVTVDRVRDLEFIGGAILPGPRMMLAAMAEHAAQLPSIDLDDLETLFPDTPRSTGQSMACGVGAALVGGILEAVRRLGDPDTPVWVTGGLLGRVDARLPDGWRRDPDLTLRGLFRIASRVS